MEQESGAAMFSADFKERAFPVYAAMREKGPVASVTLPTGEPIWFVTRYAEVMAMLKDDERFVNDPSSALTKRNMPYCSSRLRSISPPSNRKWRRKSTKF